jgi:hypothetical protein
MARHQVASVFVILLFLVLGGCASGSSIVTGTPRAAITPEQVTIYTEPPAEFEVIGIVNASSDAGWTAQGSVDYAMRELKKRAAKLGANGVLLVSSGDVTTGVVMMGSVGVPVTGKTVQGKAIFVTKK